MNGHDAALQKADRQLREALESARADESLTALLSLRQPIEAEGPTLRPGDFPSRRDYRSELIRRKQAEFDQLHGATIKALRELGLNPRGGSLGVVVVTGPAENLTQGLELPDVVRGTIDRQISQPASSL